MSLELPGSAQSKALQCQLSSILGQLMRPFDIIK